MRWKSHQTTDAASVLPTFTHACAVEPLVPYVDNIHEVIKKPFLAKGPHQFAMNASNIVAPAALPFGDILANLLATFAAFGHHSLLWPKATTFEWSQRPYLQLLAAIVRYDQYLPW